jgi:polyhydroxyalkanoate synthesis regulator phasin
MTDDIVTRLRDSSGMTTSRSDDGFLSIHPDTDLMRQAADEIERLREQVRILEAERDQWIRQAIGNG